MPSLFDSNIPVREVGPSGIQYVCGRHTLTAADTPANTKIGRIPAGCLITVISSRVVTAVTGGTPVLGIGTTTATVGTNGNLNAVMAEAVGSENLVPSATVAQPLASDTDIYVGTTGGATAGDVIIAVGFVRPGF
jgi:hypothetical protein